MTTAPDDGLEKVSDEVLTEYDEVAVGTGQGESTGATSLGNEEYRGSVADNNIDIRETGSTGEYEAAIEVGGGLEVTAGAEISEMGLFIDGVLVLIDEFTDVPVPNGHREEFTMPADFTR
jgi:hypothetical protein